MDNSELNLILENGIKNHQQNKLIKASNCYEEVLKLDGKNLKANLFLGIIFAQQKKFLEAERQFNKSLKIDPGNSDVFNNLGLIYKETDQIKKSINSFNKAIELNPNFIPAYNNLGLIYHYSKKFIKAEEVFLKVLELDKNNIDAKINLAILYKDTFKLDKAQNLFIKVINQNPTNLVALINYGNLLKVIGDKKKSEECFKKAIEINSKYFPAYNNLIVLYERTNQNQKLKELIDKAYLYFPENMVLKLFLGQYFYKIEDYKKSIDILNNIKFHKNEIQQEKLRCLLLAKNYDKIGNTDLAFKFFLDSNKISLDMKEKNIDKDKALKNIINRIQHFKNKRNYTFSNLNDKKAPVFLIGFPRSGTTLLDTILRSHPEIDVLEEKPITTDMLNHLQKIINGDLNNLDKINDEQIINLKNEYFKNLEDNKDKNKNSRLVIDKMPLNIVHVGEIIRVFPDAKFIVALRHPSDSVLSCFMQNFRLNDSMANFLNIDDTAKMYNLVMTLWKQYINSFSINYHLIKYEDVVTNFKETMEPLLKFLDIPWSENILKFYETAQSRNLINTPSYDQVYKPLYSESTNRWKKYENKIKHVLPILKPWVKEFNY